MSNKRGLWYYIRSYRFQSILVKNFIIILLLVIIPLAGMSTLIYRSSNQIVESEISQLNTNSLYRVRDLLDTVFRQANLLTTQISQQTNTQLFFLDYDNEAIIRGKYSQINQTINMFTLIYDYINSVYVYSERNHYIIANTENNFYNQFADKTWVPIYEQSNDGYSRTYPRKSREIYPYLLSFIKPSFLNSTEKIGAVVVNIDLEELSKLIRNKDGQTDQDIYIFDEQNRMLYSRNNEFLFEDDAQSEIVLSAAYKLDKPGIVTLGGERYMLSKASLDYNNWTCVSLLPMSSFAEKNKSLVRYTVALLIVVAIIGIIIAVLISLRTYQPIRKIITVMDDTNNWRKEGLSNLDSSASNELKYISHNIVQSAESNKRMEGELERRLALLNEAQASALQAQINPHFIYNTLETINWMAIELTGGENEVSQTIGTLSQLLQLSLDMEKRIVPIRVELEHAKLYLQIMQIRYKDAIKVEWDISDEIVDLQMVKLSIQPIIENAIYHGIKPKRSAGKLRITGRLEGNEVVIHVTDDGIGIDKAATDQLNRDIMAKSLSEAQHIGLSNVNQRIRLMFGESFGLKIESELGSGTHVTIRVPRIEYL